MDWTAIVIGLLSTTTLGDIFSALVFFRQNRALKSNEVKQSDVDTQRQQIELAELYKDKMLGLLEQVSQKQDTGNDNQTKMLDKLDTLDSRMDGVETRVSDIVAYLNGNFQDFLKEQHRKPTRK